MKDALLKCETEHAFDAILEFFYTEMTPNELATLAGLPLSPAYSRLPVKDRFVSTQKFLTETIVPLSLKQSWRRQRLTKYIRLYTGPEIEPKDKTLIVGFGGNLFRLMMPLWTFCHTLMPEQQTCSLSGTRRASTTATASRSSGKAFQVWRNRSAK